MAEVMTPTRRTVIGGIGGATLIAVAGCGRSSGGAGRVRIANASGGLNMTLAQLLKDRGYLEAFGLEPELLQIADGSKIVGGMVGGSIDISAMSGFGQIFPAIARGGDLKVIGGGILLPTLAMFTAKPGITSLKDLEGRVVGTGSIGALTYQLTATLLGKHGVDLAKIGFVNVGSSVDVLRAVAAGTVDAGAGQASLIETAAAMHVRAIPGGDMTTELREFTYSGAWASGHAIATMRDTLVRTLAAYGRLYRFVQEPSSQDAFLKARRTVFPAATPAEHAAEWAYIQRTRPFAVDLAIGPERIDYLQRLNVGFGVQKAVLPFTQVADMSLARDAVALLAKG